MALEYPGPWQLVVWDNGSTDQTLSHVRERLRGIGHARLIESPENRGVVYPMNARAVAGGKWTRGAAVFHAARVGKALVPRGFSWGGRRRVTRPRGFLLVAAALYQKGLPESEAPEFNVERYSVTAAVEPERDYGLTRS